MPSLRELQQEFAGVLLDAEAVAATFAVDGDIGAAARIAIYRNNVFGNYRNALAATYPVVRRLTGAPFFDAAADAYVLANPSRTGDLNVYGDTFGDFLAGYAPAASLAYLPDVARLEWAIDGVGRAGEPQQSPDAVLAALATVAPDRLPAVHLALAPTSRLVTSAYPIRRIWQVNQPDHVEVEPVALDAGGDVLLVRRETDGIAILRLGAGEGAWLAALARGAELGKAIDVATTADPDFDFAQALHAHLTAATFAAVVTAPDAR
jgi:hypothetical protein